MSRKVNMLQWLFKTSLFEIANMNMSKLSDRFTVNQLATYLASFSVTYLATLLKLAKFSVTERTADVTSCRRAAATVCPALHLLRGRRSAFRHRADGNVAAVFHGQHVLMPTTPTRWWAKRPGDLDLWPLDLENGVPVYVTWATSVPNLVFLGLSVLDLGPMYATDRQTDRRQTKASLNAPAY